LQTLTQRNNRYSGPTKSLPKTLTSGWCYCLRWE